MRTLLINSPVERPSPHARVSPPLGLAYLAGRMRDAGHDVHILDLNLTGYNPRRLDLTLDRVRPDLVGISAYTETYPNALRIAAQVKQRDSSTSTVLGGAHPSIMPANVLARDEADYAVVGEGEETLVELAAAIEARAGFDHVRGLAWKRGDELVVNERRPLLPPDAVGWPARDLLSLEFYADAFNVLTARGGCPYRCPFCSASHIWSGKHRPRDPGSVVDEIGILMRTYGADFVFFVDDIFTLRRSWVIQLLSEMERLPPGLTWGCGTRVDCVDAELLREMAARGCVGIQFGVESGSQRVLDSVKGIDKQRALDAIRWSVAVGIHPTASFMVPFPQDTEETLRETFAFMETLKDAGAELMMSYTTPYPGTVFYEQAADLGLSILTTDWAEFDAKHVIMETANLSAARIQQIAEEGASRLGLRRSA
jgi:radical SAM superfamily enzyme YgiQ (UPF0313 family)